MIIIIIIIIIIMMTMLISDVNPINGDATNINYSFRSDPKRSPRSVHNHTYIHTLTYIRTHTHIVIPDLIHNILSL